MRTPACFGIFILLRLFMFARMDDHAVSKPPKSDLPDYSRKTPEICYMDNKPFYCPKALQELTHVPYAINARFARHGGLIPQDPSFVTLSGRGTQNNVLQKPPLKNSPQRNLQWSFQYSSSPKVLRSFSYNSPPFEHEKFIYEETSAGKVLRVPSEISTLPKSHDNVIEGSETTAEPLYARMLKPDEETVQPVNISLFDKFTLSLDQFQSKFYQTTFNKLLSISPQNRSENGISFAQSGLFLYMALMALSTEVDSLSATEIESNLQLQISDSDKINLLKQIVSWLPMSSNNLKFRWATRLVLEPGLKLSGRLLGGTANALSLHVDLLNGNETLKNLTKKLNCMVRTDSGGAMRNTFEEDDLAEGTCSILLSTTYVRARWRSPPTVLNDSRPFRDSEDVHSLRSVRMIRINDIMRYAALQELNAEALEIRYATPGLTLLLLVPQGPSLKSLATNMTSTSLREIDSKLREMRIAAILPIYTLRMTLLLPGKLRAMGISRLADANNTPSSGCGQLRLSHAVQRIMFWAEAGRNAYKDDGIEWDETPEKELVVDRPYLFYVRWKNVTLMNGNFVL